MNIVLGASGQIGSMLVDNLLKDGVEVRAVVHSCLKEQALKNKGVEVITADFFDVEALKKAFRGGDTVFLLTPENPVTNNFIGDTRSVLINYRDAALTTGIPKVVGLSSMGAQHETGTGNLEASYMLEHTFQGIDIEQIFVRPAYYFSNWMGYLELVKEQGVLPTFFPPDMRLPMIAPPEVAAFLVEVMKGNSRGECVYEIIGPSDYNAVEIAETFGEVLGREVSVKPIPPEEWEEAFMQIGFSEDGARNFMLMTKAVIDGKARNDSITPIRLSMNFKEYLNEYHLKG